MDDFISKPVVLAQLAAALERCARPGPLSGAAVRARPDARPGWASAAGLARACRPSYDAAAMERSRRVQRRGRAPARRCRRGRLAELQPTKSPEGRTPLGLITEVALAALADAGLAPADVDGIVVCPAMMQYSMLWPSVVAEHLGLSPTLHGVRRPRRRDLVRDGRARRGGDRERPGDHRAVRERRHLGSEGHVPEAAAAVLAAARLHDAVRRRGRERRLRDGGAAAHAPLRHDRRASSPRSPPTSAPARSRTRSRCSTASR